jgi:hypothetical protein
LSAHAGAIPLGIETTDHDLSIVSFSPVMTSGSIDPTKSMVTILNPWGSNGTYNDATNGYSFSMVNGYFTTSLSTMLSAFHEFVAPTSIINASDPESRHGVTTTNVGTNMSSSTALYSAVNTTSIHALSSGLSSPAQLSFRPNSGAAPLTGTAPASTITSSLASTVSRLLATNSSDSLRVGLPIVPNYFSEIAVPSTATLVPTSSSSSASSVLSLTLNSAMQTNLSQSQILSDPFPNSFTNTNLSQVVTGTEEDEMECIIDTGD